MLIKRIADRILKQVGLVNYRRCSSIAVKKTKEKLNGEEHKLPESDPWPSYISSRLEKWNRLKAQYDTLIAEKIPQTIKVTLPDGKTVGGESWRTTPYQLAQRISQELADTSIVAKVNGTLWDLDRPLEGDCSLEFVKFEDEEGQRVFWHSSAHVMGEALERVYCGHLYSGPPIESGFFYDMFIEDKKIHSTDFPNIEGVVKSITKEKQRFERLELTKEDLLEIFKYNPFKVHILNTKVKTPTTTAYRCGTLIDLCRGPHIRHTGKIKAFSVVKNSSTNWKGELDEKLLQRFYGISFPDLKQMKEWKQFHEEAVKRDHRKLGMDQELFFFHELSPGSCFFQPKGAHIYNTLIQFIRVEYRKRGYLEVITPNIYKSKLWEMSGHWQHFAENMFSFPVENETFSLKPMNCPGHCLMFDKIPRSWRELPLRYADFGVLHRNEPSVTGLTRVRRFQQDDAHIFCTIEQISEEISGCLDFLQSVYGIFGFSLKLNLSTRPINSLGDKTLWNHAEKQLTESLNSFGQPWQLSPGEGAFYGPKIDITITDALKRHHQCGTIQLDFQLPIKFNLSYIDNIGEKKTPVIIHRAMLGSVERMIAILTENFGGKWPFWLSPRQVMVIPVSSAHDKYAQKVRDEIYSAGYMCDIDTDTRDRLNKKIRSAQVAQYNFILVTGDKEMSANTVNVRTRDNKVHGERSISEMIARFKTLTSQKLIKSEEGF